VWRQQQPDPDNPDDAFEDRYARVGTTFGGTTFGGTTLGGAAVIRGNRETALEAAVSSGRTYSTE
jgi:hypothetical protein